MKSIHLVIPDLFLPQEVAAEVCAGLALPSLEKLLARAQPAPLSAESLEAWLCGAFGVTELRQYGMSLRGACHAAGLSRSVCAYYHPEPLVMSGTDSGMFTNE